MDDSNTGALNLQDFAKVLRDYRLELDEVSLRSLVGSLDRDKSGWVRYDEFLQGVRGPFPSGRKHLAELAFAKIDGTGSGQVDVAAVKGLYNAKSHPDVRAGKKTEDEALGEFLDTFEMHHGPGNEKVTREEFLDYYHFVSASIEDDKLFDLLLRHVWTLINDQQQKSAWRQPYAKPGKPLSVTQAAPFGTTDVPTDYSPWKRPKSGYQAQGEEQKSLVPAGYPSWPKYEVSKTASRPTQAQPPAQAPQPAEFPESIFRAFRQTLLSRGVRGVFGLQRAFRVRPARQRLSSPTKRARTRSRWASSKRS